MPPSRLEQFIRFGTDAAAIERILRMVQAILMFTLSQPILISGFFYLVAVGNQYVWTDPRVASIAALHDLRSKVALVRRFFRMFRFLESFHAAQVAYTSLYAPAPAAAPPPAGAPAPPTTTASGPANRQSRTEKVDEAKTPDPQPAQVKTPAHHHHHHHHRKRSTRAPTEAWLDIFSRTFNGMYLLLETLTLIDALSLPGLSLLGTHWSSILHTEGQRFWFFALVCGLFAGLLKLVKVFAYAPVPPTGAGYGGTSGEKMEEWELMRERMRRAVAVRKESRRLWRREMRVTGGRLARRCLADFLDLALPGSVVGWVKVGSGTVGWCMVVSTWLTGREVWERCGREVGRL